MATEAILPKSGEAGLAFGAAAPARPAIKVQVRALADPAAVESAWAALAAGGVESPGQAYGFIRLWTERLGVKPADQLYLLAEAEGRPLALLPLWRRRARGIRLLSWFPGAHIGCNAPLLDAPRLLALGAEGRRALWRQMLGQVRGADLLYLKAVPLLPYDGVDLLAELGATVAADHLHRAAFTSWDEANLTQRSKSRRKHDRQQGERLEALGTVEFEEIRGGDRRAPAVLDLMFRQRAARFRAMGVPDAFCDRQIRAFYDATVLEGSGVDIRLHVLRLNEQIVAVRYNVAAGDRLFCLISSMSDDPLVQTGSPGKQCLLRVMQTVFDAGCRSFDMGAGLTDEKRHWCNQQIPLRHVYVPLTPLGQGAAGLHRSWQAARQRIKNDPKLLKLVKVLRGRLLPRPAEAARQD